MLESGYAVFDGKVEKLLSENDVYQSYLVKYPDSTMAKLLLLQPDPLFAAHQLQAFIDQANWLAGQTFPGIGTPHQVGEVNGQPACLYFLPPGVPLSQTADTRFSVRQTVELVRNIAKCLSAPHSAGSWHGNLSTETIYLDSEAVFLADFSLSQLFRLDYRSGINPQYTSPEQVRGEVSEAAVDIYSLGCIFFQQLTGQPPFSGADPFAIAKQHLQGEFPRLPEELNLLQPLLATMTDAVSTKRISLAKLIDQLTRLLSQQQLDLLQLSNLPADLVSSDKSAARAEVTSPDNDLDKPEITARIEARLKEHAESTQKTVPIENQNTEKNMNMTEPGRNKLQKKSRLGLFVLTLFFGIVVGTGFFYLFYKLPVASQSAVGSQIKAEDSSIAHLDLGVRLWQQADFNGAEAAFKQVISEHQNDPRGYNNLAAFYAAQGNYEQARVLLESALAIDEKYSTIYRNLGAVYAEMARGSYGRALQLDKGQTLVSLPVFSSQGVINLQPITVAMIAVHEDDSAAKLNSNAVTAEELPASVEVVSAEPSLATQIVVAGQLEQFAAVATEVDSSIVVAGHPAEVVIDEATEKSELGTVVTLDSKSEEPESFLRRWAQAWSSQNASAYLTFYSDQFIPPAGKKRKDWEVQRHARLTAPKEITIGLEGFKITTQANNRVQVEVIQSYKSDLLSDRTSKIFDLQQTDDSWKIVRERSLGRVR